MTALPAKSRLLRLNSQTKRWPRAAPLPVGSHGARLYIVENVDAEVCTECGERYFHATTLDAIDKLLAGDHVVKEVLSVEVVSA